MIIENVFNEIKKRQSQGINSLEVSRAMGIAHNKVNCIFICPNYELYRIRLEHALEMNKTKKCTDCKKEFKSLNPRKRLCGSVEEKTGCAYIGSEKSREHKNELTRRARAKLKMLKLKMS